MTLLFSSANDRRSGHPPAHATRAHSCHTQLTHSRACHTRAAKIPSSRWLTRLAAQGCLLLILALVGGPAAARLAVSEYLYTASNRNDGNMIHAFVINDQGLPQELTASPFATGGLGNRFPPFSQNGVITSKDGRFLFVVNQGSNDISVFRIRADGGLHLVPGSPFSSGGTFPISLALSGNILYVSHMGPNGLFLGEACVDCELRGFKVRPNGALQLMPEATVNLPEAPAAFPTAIQFNPRGDVLVVTLTNLTQFLQPDTAELHTYRLDRRSGRLSHAPGSPFVVRPGSNQPIGFTFSPINDSHLFVSNGNADTPPQPGNVSTYLMAASGQVNELDSSPVPANSDTDNALATCWVVMTSDGRNLYTTNTVTDNVSRYRADLAGNLNLIEVIDVPPVDRPNDLPVDMAISAGDEYLYALQTLTSNIAAWHIEPDGSLVELPGAPVELPAGIFPYGLAAARRVRVIFD